MNINFLHCADLHIGIKSYSKSSDDRLLDWQRAFENMISYADKNKIPYVFIVGDLFDQDIPNVDSIVIANKCLKLLSEKVKHIFLIAGNHDINSISKKRHILESITIENIHILDETKVYSIPEIPFDIVHYHYLNSDKKLHTSNPNIVTFHGNIKNAINDLNHSAGEQQIENKKLISTNPAYVALGHIHKRQIMHENSIPLVYPGSFIQTSFSERNVDKGFLHVNISDNEVKTKFIKNTYIEYKHINDISEITLENVENKIIQINISLSASDKINYKEILNKAFYIKNNFVSQIEQINSNKEININSDIDIQSFNIDDLIKDNLSKNAQALLAKVIQNAK